MEIACLIVVSVIACGALALAYFVVRRLPQSDYRAAEIMAQNNLTVWERGYHFGQENAGGSQEPVTPALRISPGPQPELAPSGSASYEDQSETTIINPASPE